METSYWDNVLHRRLSRRRALAATSATAAAAALLAACGGSDGDSGGESTSGLISRPVDTSNQAKRGGVFRSHRPSEPGSLDVHTDSNPLNGVKAYVYGNLLQQKAGYLQETDYVMEPALAQSWEWSADRLTVTMKMRPNVKWHNKPPINGNGRTMDIDDIVFSWNRFVNQGSYRSAVANVASPDAPILSMTATDSSTLVFKLKQPVVWMETFFGAGTTGRLVIVPKETDGAFQIRGDMIGTGPFVMEKYTPSVGFTFKRNPEYYEKDRPYVDEIDAPIVLEYATGLAQFKAGNIYDYSVRPDDILSTKTEVPALKVYQTQPNGFTVNPTIAFSYLPGSPFLDERVRQALSLSYDRDLFIDTFTNASRFQSEGLSVDTYWNSSINSGGGSWWLNPKSSSFGPNAKYYEHNIAEAKRLLTAAGFANGLDVKSTFIQGTQLGADFQRRVEVLEGFASEVGFRQEKNLIDYTQDYIPNLRDARGQHEGIGYKSGVPTAQDAVSYLIWRFSVKGGPGFLGFDAQGRGNMAGDPHVESELTKAEAEVDVEKRKALVHELQRYNAKTMYSLLNPGLASGFTITWPAVGNFQVFQGDNRGAAYSYWMDATQPPLKPA
jgi:ABC-type transport system substrate-binding protein